MGGWAGEGKVDMCLIVIEIEQGYRESARVNIRDTPVLFCGHDAYTTQMANFIRVYTKKIAITFFLKCNCKIHFFFCRLFNYCSP